jgi:GDPmannose 4,6-dehydratase
MRRAIIVGATGQDGTFLYRLLEAKGYSVFGIGRSRVVTNCRDWQDEPAIDISDFRQVSALVHKIQPDEIYHLAAVHHSSEDAIPDPVMLFGQSYTVNVTSLFNVLEAIRQFSPKTRLFYAASSHIFGRPDAEPQDENTRISPLNIYAVTKVTGLHLCRMYRTVHGIFASVGILYNHESPLRGEQFVSGKIARGAVRCKKDPSYRLVLGNLTGEVDWGYAPDYADAMHRIVNLPEADDFVIATGEKHTVEDFVRIAFETVGLDWRKYVTVREEIITRPAVAFVGNPAKLVMKTGWQRSVTFPGMVKLLVEAAGGNDGRH